MPNSSLAQFLAAPRNSVSREVIFAHRLSYELKVASAQWGWDLRVYRPDVDREGFDMLVVQASIARALQLKTVSQSARTVQWTVKSHLLHPSRNRRDRLRFPPVTLGLGDGLDGAVVLLDFAVTADDVSLSYRFFDAAVAAAHACGLTGQPDDIGIKAESLLEKLRKLRGKETVTVPASLFLRVPTAEGLLALLGMRTRLQGSWDYNVLYAYATQFRGRAEKRTLSPAEVRDLAVIALEEIQRTPRRAAL